MTERIHLHWTAESETIRTLIEKIQELMYGYNYEAHFGIIKLDGCNNIGSCVTKLEENNQDREEESTIGDMIKPTETSEIAMFKMIKSTFKHRGSNSAGLKLNETKENELLKLQNEYLDTIISLVGVNSKIFSYPNEENMPCYSVFWNYGFIVCNEKTSYFICGAASD